MSRVEGDSTHYDSHGTLLRVSVQAGSDEWGRHTVDWQVFEWTDGAWIELPSTPVIHAGVKVVETV